MKATDPNHRARFYTYRSSESGECRDTETAWWVAQLSEAKQAVAAHPCGETIGRLHPSRVAKALQAKEFRHRDCLLTDDCQRELAGAVKRWIKQ